LKRKEILRAFKRNAFWVFNTIPLQARKINNSCEYRWFALSPEFLSDALITLGGKNPGFLPLMGLSNEANGL
jgi:hypothetical protein